MELSINDKLATLTLAGPGTFNDVSLNACNQALDLALSNEEVDLLLITGEGKNFSQGLDLEHIIGLEDPAQGMAFVRQCMEMVGRLLTFPMPVASALNGHAFGLGAMIALASDYKVMREDRGYFCLPEVSLGMTLTKRMNALVCGKLSGNVLRDVLLTGKQMTASEALACGIVDAVGTEAELSSIVTALAEPMRGKKRESLAGLKRGVNLDILAVIDADEFDVTL